MPRTLIRGGTVVSASSMVRADVVIADGRIAALTAPDSDLTDIDETIDARGRHVMPGGVDVHTHLETIVGAVPTADTFESGTVAAAHGGTTTVIDFVRQGVGEDALERLADAHKRAAGRCSIDYGFHQIIGDVRAESLAQLDRLVNEGVPSIKLFMAFPGELYSDDTQLLSAMEQAASHGIMVMLHAENGLAANYLRAKAVAQGHWEVPWHGHTAVAAIEAEASRRAIVLAELAGMPPLYFVHVSSAPAIAAIAEARRRGLPVYAETCPHYLFLDSSEMERPWQQAVNFVCAPPLRGREHVDALWNAIHAGDVQVVSSDHCPFCRAQLQAPEARSFATLPGGIAGVEYRLPLLYDAAMQGRLSLTRMVDITATTPARLFGLTPRKGDLTPGADADVVIFDPDASTVLERTSHHMQVDHCVYEGRRLRGRIESVLLRGEWLVRGNEWVGPRGSGQFLERRRVDDWVALRSERSARAQGALT